MSTLRPFVACLVLGVPWGCAPHAPAVEAVADVSEVVVRALPAVVLVVVTDDQGAQRYGAGVWVDDEGLVLTNQHVVGRSADIRVLFYDPTHLTYSPLDGGLARFVFEHGDALRPAELAAVDPILDLALIRTDASGQDPPPHPLPVREEPLKPGEPVLTLGHPQESVWSFTAGVVSANHHGVIQHDAPINAGNSGGPLIDARGRLVGINTSKLLGTAEGMGFARPIGLAVPLYDSAQVPAELDRSTPQAAFSSCEHALELSAELSAGCWDYGHSWAILQAGVPGAARLLGLDEAQEALVLQILLQPGDEAWKKAFHQGHVSMRRGDVERVRPIDLDFGPVWGSDEARLAYLEEHGTAAALAEEREALAAEAEAFAESLEERYGIKTNFLEDPSTYRQLRQLGVRIERLFEATPDLALLEIAGRNHDSSTYAYTECWVRHDDGWKQRVLCGPDELQHLPQDWPPAFGSYDYELRRDALGLAYRISGLEAASKVEAVVAPVPSPDNAATDESKTRGTQGG